MYFARLRPRVAVLLTSGALALAAFLAGGCSSPDGDEKSRVGTVEVAVVDVNTGAPVAGASVFVVPPTFPPVRGANAALGTRNYEPPMSNGQPFAFTTGANGRAIIPAVPVTSDRNNPVVLNIRVQAPGYLPALATTTVAETTQYAGRAFIAGQPTTDIVIATTGTTLATARLTPAGGAASTLALSPVAATNQAFAVAGSTFTLAGPAQGVSGSGTATVTGVTGLSVVGFAAAPPTGIPTASAPSAPSGAVAPNSTTGSTTADATLALGGFNLDLAGLTLSQPLTVSLTQLGGTPLNSVITGLGATTAASPLRVVFFNAQTGLWELVPSTFNATTGTLTFSVTQPGTYLVVVPARWTIGAVTNVTGTEGPVANNGNPAETSVVFPPIAAFASTGYVVSGRILENIGLNATLAAAYSALTGDEATPAPAAGPVVEVVGPAPASVRCQKVKFTVAVEVLGGSQFSGTRYTWSCTQVSGVSTQAAVPAHLQGHIQGGGAGG